MALLCWPVRKCEKSKLNMTRSLWSSRKGRSRGGQPSINCRSFWARIWRAREHRLVHQQPSTRFHPVQAIRALTKQMRGLGRLWCQWPLEANGAIHCLASSTNHRALVSLQALSTLHTHDEELLSFSFFNIHTNLVRKMNMGVATRSLFLVTYRTASNLVHFWISEFFLRAVLVVLGP